MHRALITFMVFVLLTSGMVWASDGHADLLSGEVPAMGGCLYDAPVSDDDMHQSHGCHLSSHLVAMTSDISDMVRFSALADFPSLTPRLNSRFPTPPSKPPRV